MTTTRCELAPPAPGHDVELRLARAAGQLAGVQRMLAEDRPPLEVIDQLHAVAAAVDAVAMRVAEQSLADCVEAGPSADAAVRAVAVLRRVVRRP